MDKDAQDSDALDMSRASALHSLSKELFSTKEFIVFARKVVLRWDMAAKYPSTHDPHVFYTQAIKLAVPNDIDFYHLLCHHAPTKIAIIRKCAREQFDIPDKDLEQLANDFEVSERLICNREAARLRFIKRLCIAIFILVVVLLALSSFYYWKLPSDPAAPSTRAEESCSPPAPVAPKPVATGEAKPVAPAVTEPAGTKETKPPTEPEPPSKSGSDSVVQPGATVDPPQKKAVKPKSTPQPVGPAPDEPVSPTEPAPSSPAEPSGPVVPRDPPKCPTLEEVKDYALATLQQNAQSNQHLNAYRYSVEGRLDCQAPPGKCKIIIESIDSSLSSADAKPVIADFNFALAAAPLPARDCPTMPFSLKAKKKTTP